MDYALNKLSIAAIALSWLLFVLSFFLPARDGMTGWEAFLTGILGALHPLIWLDDARIFLFLIYLFANPAMLFAPLLCLVLREHSFGLAVLFIPSGLLPWFISPLLMGNLEVGFYAWDASFFIMSFGCVAATGASLYSEGLLKI